MDARKIQIYERTIEVGKLARTREDSWTVAGFKTGLRFSLFLFFFAVVSLLIGNSAFAQGYPATLKVPVTFYDFHSDGSNPEFEKNPDAIGTTGTHRGMVAATLGPNGTPTLGPTPYWDCDIAKWFVDWTPGDSTIPNYIPPAIPATPGMYNCSNGFKKVNYDTAFKNVEIDTFLIFTYVPGSQGSYQFQSAAFFPLDGRGFGADETNTAWRNHNYSFSMKLHWQFTYVSGLTFQFAGDDDLWAFINNKLALDIGGIHNTTLGSLDVDTLGLTPGNQYNFDLFYCERHATGSDIEITTNIITAKPTSINMVVVPAADTISAGDSIMYLARILDQNGVPAPQFNKSIKWTLWTLPGPALNTTNSFLRFANDSINTFKAVTAYTKYVIQSNLDTIATGGAQIHLSWADTVYVKPGPATHLNIEASPMVSLFSNSRLVSITMSGTTQLDSVYAVLRDQFGNWVSDATSASWLTRNQADVTVTVGNAQIGQGVIQRQTPNNATTYITATQGSFTDSLQVSLTNVTYSALQIYVISGGVKPIDTLRMRTDQDTVLHARGLRADGSGTFDDLLVQWGNTSGLTFNNSAPTTGAFTWEFVPQAPGTGIIYAFFNSAGKILNDTIQVIFTNGLPNSMRLYPQAGKPDTLTNVAFNAGATITVTAGVPFSIVANLFDNKGQWLSSYERAGAPFSWTNGSPTVGSLDSLHGFITNFTGRKAYSISTITATFVENGITLTQSINIYVNPGPPNHLTLEADTSRATSPNSDNRAVRVTIDSSATTAQVYAILRDQFGNWVGYSSSTAWSTSDSSRATAAAGNASIGQGIITRIANTGQATIYANDLNHPGFMDSVLVVLSTVTYDSLRIVVNDSVQINSLTMRTDQDTSLQVLGRRSDTKTWESVPGNWAIAPSVSITPSPAQNSNYWGPFTPNDTGHGTITVSFAKAAPASITFAFTHGLPARIAIYPSDGAPSASNAPYPGPTTALIDTAGRPLTMVIKVFDKNNIWLSSYQGDSLTTFKWNIQELIGNPPTGTMSGVIGYKSSFNPVRAYNSVYIIATFDTAGAKYYDTVQVQVVPGAPGQLVIEADQNWQNSPNKANPVDSIQINSSETYRDVYAIVRDSLGNFIKYSLQTNWTSINNSKVFDTSVVSAQNGLNSIGQGVVKRVGAQGTAWVVASSGEYSGLTDTIKATVLAYYYTQLRIISRDTTRMGTLTMSTNDDTTLSAIGLRSDTAKWEPVSVEWDTSSGVHVAPSAPERSINWAFSPVTPGSGWIRITVGSDATTKPDTVFVTFTRGAPTSISIQLITPPSQIIAGDTVTAVVSIRNKDGLVPDTLCDTTSYQELLGSGGGGRPNPIITVDGTTSGLKQAPSYSTPTYECFNNGLDTVKYVFYYAPVNKDSLQQIFVDFHNLSASTPGFNVLPGALSSLAIQNVSGKNLDTVDLTYPNGAQTMVAVGFDAFGNIVSLDNGANWTQTNTLHSIDKPTGVTRIYYDASDVKSDEQGYIKALVVDAKGAIVQDSVYVSIIGQPTSLKAAVTQDLNGNGYLDAIVLHFDKLTTIPAGYNFDSLISVSYNYGEQNILFPIDSIAGVPSDSGITSQARTDSVFTIYLDEKNSIKMHLPQTAWTPSISISGLNATTPVNNKVTIDGAGPVVWTVVKSITQLTNRKSDLVTITFSEPIQQSNGSAFNLKTPPDSVFNVWRDSSGVLLLDTNLLSGIASFASISSDGKTVTFYMDNGADLTGLDFISLKSDSSKIVDQANQPNAPSKINQKMPVVVISHTPNIITVIPNPAAPSNNPGTLSIDYNSNAKQLVQTQGGVALDFLVPLSSDSTNSITGYLKIFDIVGNLVCEAGDNHKNLLSTAEFTQTTSVQHYYIYWNGQNAKQRKVAPGVYRAILYLTTTSTGSTERLIATIGIRR